MVFSPAGISVEEESGKNLPSLSRRAIAHGYCVYEPWAIALRFNRRFSAKIGQPKTDRPVAPVDCRLMK